MSHYQYKLCETCIKRNCRKTAKNIGTNRWVCNSYRKHVSGFPIKELLTEGEIICLKTRV